MSGIFNNQWTAHGWFVKGLPEQFDSIIHLPWDPPLYVYLNIAIKTSDYNPVQSPVSPVYFGLYPKIIMLLY